jgi:hypothetical protein
MVFLKICEIVIKNEMSREAYNLFFPRIYRKCFKVIEVYNIGLSNQLYYL